MLRPAGAEGRTLAAARRRVDSVRRHVVGGDSRTVLAQQLETRLQELQAEKDALQLELGKVAGLGVETSFFKGASMEQAEEFFRRNGYWVFKDAVSGEWLARLQEKWLEAAAPARELWERAHAVNDEPLKPAPPISVPDLRGQLRHAPGYFDIPRFAEYDESMLHLLDNPRIIPLLQRVMGGKVQVKQIQGRTVPAEAADRYTRWHRDGGANIQTHPLHSPSIKVFTFPFDVPADGGCAAVVPGSHRTHMLSPAGPVRDDPHSMPDHVTFPARAGTAVAYDNRIWHNAFPNTSGQDRRCLICSYGPYGTSQSGQVVANARRLYAAGKLGADQPMLRQLLGWRLGLGEVSYSEPEHHERHPTPDNR